MASPRLRNARLSHNAHLQNLGSPTTAKHANCAGLPRRSDLYFALHNQDVVAAATYAAQLIDRWSRRFVNPYKEKSDDWIPVSAARRVGARCVWDSARASAGGRAS